MIDRQQTDDRALDLSPMTFHTIEYSGRTLRLDPPLTLLPRLDDSEQLLVASDDTLGIHVFAQTREGLIEELAEQLLFAWDVYAMAPPDRLTESAQQLRAELRRRLQEVA